MVSYIFNICGFNLQDTTKGSMCQAATTNRWGNFEFSTRRAGLVQKQFKIRLEFIPELTSVNHDPVDTY